MHTSKVLITLCVISMSACFAQAETLIWSDEFDGSAVDTAAWNFETGGGGWGNSELQNYQVENASVSGGSLVIDILSSGGRRPTFTSARLTTQNKVSFQYGHIVARINFPDLADGLWPAFWTLGADFSTAGWPDCGELDIVEMGSAAAIAAGTVNRTVGSTAHWDYQGSYAGYGLTYDATNDLNGSFHVFEMQWTPTMIDTYIDGQHIWAFDISPIEEASLHEFHQPHFMIVNCAVGGSFTGITNSMNITAPFPAQMLVDYVRVYDNGYTTNVTIPTSAVCGDGTCDPGEDECNCSDDCGTPPATESNCTDGIDEDCDGGADCDDPTGDCDNDPACQSGGSCNNDGTCDAGEDCTTCPNDCISKTSGNPNSQYCCGDGTCEGSEDSSNCAIDCGSGPVCGDGTCDPGEDNSNCPADCPPSACDNDGICEPGEDCLNCANDCEGVTGGRPANRYCCGDGEQTGPEGDGRCDGNY